MLGKLEYKFLLTIILLCCFLSINTLSVNAAPLIPTLTNAETYLNITTYDGSGESVHPAVVYRETAWNGYHYFMAYTPYPSSNPTHENPSIRASNDGVTWVNITGIPDPLIPIPGSGFNSDANIEFAGDTMYVFYRWADSTEPTVLKHLYVTVSEDLSISEPVEQIGLPWLRSCSYIKTGNGWDCFGHNMTTSKLEYWTTSSPTPNSGWVSAGTVILSTPNYNPWHSEVKKVNDEYVILISARRSADSTIQDLLYGYSANGLIWVMTPTPVLMANPSSWDQTLYKSSFEYVNEKYQIWYGAYTGTSPQHPHIGYAETAELPVFEWGYKKYHSISNPGSDLTSYVKKITLHNTTGSDTDDNCYLGSNVKSDWGDLRFNQSYNAIDTNISLNYWIDYSSQTANSIDVYTKLNDIYANDTSGYYITYGNPAANSWSNGPATWVFIEEGNEALTADKWATRDCFVSNGIVTTNVNTVNTTTRLIKSAANYTTGHAIITRIKSSNFGVGPEYIETAGFQDRVVSIGYGSFANFYDASPAGSTYRNRNSGGSNYTNITGHTANEFAMMEIKLLSDRAVYSINDNQVVSTDNYYTGNKQIAIIAKNPGASVSFDWLAIRTVADTEPTDGIYGEETDLTPPPIPLVASFTASSFSGTNPLSVSFTDLSTGTVNAWAWDLDGDGVTDSTEQNPTYTYEDAGEYTVSLTVTNDGGSNTTVKSNYIAVNSPAEINAIRDGMGEAAWGAITVIGLVFLACVVLLVSIILITLRRIQSGEPVDYFSIVAVVIPIIVILVMIPIGMYIAYLIYSVLPPM